MFILPLAGLPWVKEAAFLWGKGNIFRCWNPFRLRDKEQVSVFFFFNRHQYFKSELQISSAVTLTVLGAPLSICVCSFSLPVSSSVIKQTVSNLSSAWTLLSVTDPSVSESDEGSHGWWPLSLCVNIIQDTVPFLCATVGKTKQEQVHSIDFKILDGS